MLKKIREKIDGKQQTRYVFEYVGDVLPRHEHPVFDYHDTIVTRGTIKITGPGWEIIGRGGDTIEYDDYKASDHEFEALEDDTEIISKYKFNSIFRDMLEFDVWF